MESSRNAVTLDRPVVVPTKTESLHGDWITSGTVRIAVLQGGSPAIGTLELPYRDAASEQDAIKQAVGPLEAIVGHLSDLLGNLKGVPAAAAESVPPGMASAA